MMHQPHKHCQSCGMPLKRDEQGGGTNANGSMSTTYYSHCYQQGKIAQPDITVEQMQARVRQKLIEFGFPGFLTGLFTRRIPKLVRWRSDCAKSDRVFALPQMHPPSECGCQ